MHAYIPHFPFALHHHICINCSQCSRYLLCNAPNLNASCKRFFLLFYSFPIRIREVLESSPPSTSFSFFSSFNKIIYIAAFAAELVAEDALQCIHSFVFINFYCIFNCFSALYKSTQAWQIHQTHSEKIAIRYCTDYQRSSQ